MNQLETIRAQCAALSTERIFYRERISQWGVEIKAVRASAEAVGVTSTLIDVLLDGTSILEDPIDLNAAGADVVTAGVLANSRGTFPAEGQVLTVSGVADASAADVSVQIQLLRPPI